MRWVYLLIIALFLFSCAPQEEDDGLSTVTGNAINIQKIVCESAHENNGCGAKLVKLGVVSAKECCSEYELCCE